MLALLPLAGRLPVHARIMVGLIGDHRVPTSRKAMLAAAVAYSVSPIDLLPDRIPILGMLDDVVMAALALDTFLDGVPDEALEERLAAVGLSRAEFDDDMLRVRRLAPRPLRRLAQRLPAALDLAARVARDAGLEARARGLLDNVLNKEGSPA
jgi:uncharacterized membrane protein YkvA (DUF1232 family)